MGKEYDLKPWKLGESCEFYELFPTHVQKTPLEKMQGSKRTEDFINLSNQIERIMIYGVQVSCSTNKLRCLDGSLGLYEIKHYSGTYRYLCFIELLGPLIVLLREFEGHKGSGNIHDEIGIGKKILGQANDCLKELRERKGAGNHA